MAGEACSVSPLSSSGCFSPLHGSHHASDSCRKLAPQLSVDMCVAACRVWTCAVLFGAGGRSFPIVVGAHVHVGVTVPGQQYMGSKVSRGCWHA